MKLGRDALITIIVAVIAAIIPHIAKGWALPIIGIILGIAAFIYGLSAFRGDKKNIWNIIAVVLGILGIISAAVKIITLL